MEISLVYVGIALCWNILLEGVHGLECYKCHDVVIKFVSRPLEPYLSSVTKRNKHCRESVDESTPGVEIITCPVPQPGNVSKCIYMHGMANGTVQFFDHFTLDVDVRDCIEVPSREKDTCENGSHRVKLIADVLKDRHLNMKSYDGAKCLCSTSTCNGGRTHFLSLTTWLFCAGLFFIILPSVS